MAQPVRMHGRISGIRDHLSGLRGLTIETSRRIPKFTPGQFLHLAIELHDPTGHWPESRVFSIASSPENRKEVEILFSQVGRFTQEMMRLQVGDKVSVKLPYGEFIVETSWDNPVVIVAGGTGVVPFVSWLRTSSLEIFGPVRVLYGAKSSSALVFRDLINDKSKNCDFLEWTSFVELDPQDGDIRGKISLEATLKAAWDAGALEKARFYLSGPPAMIAFLKAGLFDAGVQPDSVHVDVWD
ncbi:MAG: FAD-dependent oxidoreductase [Planctomycetota bacterium]